MTRGDDLDRIDLAILTVLRDADEPMWKKDVHRTLRRSASFPAAASDISVQTTGRRIDTLNEAGLVEPSIITPEELNRDLIIAYELTGEGKAALAAERRRLLRDHARPTCPDRVELPHRFLADLFADEIQAGPRGRYALITCSTPQLTALVSAYWLRRGAGSRFDPDEVAALADPGHGCQELAALARQLRSMADGR
ncbi:MAG: hypothetical protein SVU88_00265 [Candidatus Nanohaloarchaea archaeon]|nr:hypothetical protein [Candidatus Nanohaloarchaea archaeon]